MIVIYLNSNQQKSIYNDKLEQMIYHTDSYNFSEVTVVTEKIPTVIRDILQVYKPYQFIVYSLDEFENLSPTMISELILYMVDKLDITFLTMEKNLCFNQSNILEIYPKVFKHFKHRTSSQ